VEVGNSGVGVLFGPNEAQALNPKTRAKINWGNKRGFEDIAGIIN
jgi:hypothetical protein